MNLIVICVDTFRADIVGEDKKLSFVKTPNLDALASESVVFDRCFGEGEPTIPVRRCLFTGVRSFPWRFETPNEGLQPAGMGWHPIPHEQVTLAERLHDAGYCTGLVADTYHMFKPTMNFTRGFLSWRFIRGQENDAYRSGPISEIDLAAYVPDGEADPAKHPTIAQFLMNMRDRQNEEEHLTADVFRTASRWLEDCHKNAPFFLWIDSFSPHELWDVPRSYADAYFADPDVKDYIFPQVLNGRNPSPPEIERTKALYFGFVTYVDRWIGHLLNTVDTLGLRDDTIVIFITDHGTEVWDKGRFSKSADRLYPYNTQLNWFIRHPDGPKGKHISAWTQNHDFSPTVLGLLGVSHEPLDGHNVWPLATGESTEPVRDHAITGWGTNVCVRDDNHSVHLRVTGDDRQIRAYDLNADTEETKDVSEGVPQVVHQAISRVEAVTGPLPITFRRYEQMASARSMRTYAPKRWARQTPEFGENPSLVLPKAVVWQQDLVYGRGGGRDLKLDLFLPDEYADSRPGIVFIHGGGWRGGSRNQFRRQATHLASRGFIGACIEYRLSGEAIFPAAVEDAKCAVRWLRENAEKYRVEPNQIAAVGGSAGAHLAAMLGTTDASHGLEGVGGHAECSSAVDAVVAFNGVFDMTALNRGDNVGGAIQSFLGGRYDEIPDTYALASPITHIVSDKDTRSAAYLLLHGTADTTVPFQQSLSFKEKLESAGVHVELYQADGAAHGFFNRPPHFKPTLNRMEAFLVNWRYGLLNRDLRN